MTNWVVHTHYLSTKLLLSAAGLAAVTAAILIGLRSEPLKAQPADGQGAPTVPLWQTEAGGKMAFDVASVRRSNPGTFTPPSFPLSPDDSYTPNPGLFLADFPLEVYIEFAYKLWLTPEQTRSMIAPLPKWVATDSFTIHARALGNPTKDQMRLMMQSLLADRFKLAVHFETQTVPILALKLIKPGRLGPKLRPHTDGPPCNAALPPANLTNVYPHECGVYGLQRRPDHTFLLGSRNTTTALMAASLPSLGRLGRPVVDQTGLTGRFDFTIDWTPESNGPAPSGADTQTDSQGTTFLEALKEQLGLKLESTKGPMDTIVIDHIEPPSEN
jgi:bla regulator protein blaR1